MLRPRHYLSWKLQGYFSRGSGCVGLQLQLSFSSSSSLSSFFQSSSVFWTARGSRLFFILDFDVFLRLAELGNKDLSGYVWNGVPPRCRLWGPFRAARTQSGSFLAPVFTGYSTRTFCAELISGFLQVTDTQNTLSFIQPYDEPMWGLVSIHADQLVFECDQAPHVNLVSWQSSLQWFSTPRISVI